MKVYLIHHSNALTAEQDPERHLSPQGRDDADRLAARLKEAGAAPVKILHSDKQWTRETAERVASVLGLEDKTAVAAYPINTGDPVEPFMAEIAEGAGDIMMAGHYDYVMRAASRLVCGDESVRVVEFRPGNGTGFCLEDADGDWTVAFGWRPEHT